MSAIRGLSERRRGKRSKLFHDSYPIHSSTKGRPTTNCGLMAKPRKKGVSLWEDCYGDGDTINLPVFMDCFFSIFHCIMFPRKPCWYLVPDKNIRICLVILNIPAAISFETLPWKESGMMTPTTISFRAYIIHWEWMTVHSANEYAKKLDGCR